MMFKNENVLSQDIAEHFARFFDNKVVNIVSETIVNQSVYNGCQKINADVVMFMTSSKISECIDGLKLKNTKGFDRIPQRILIDGRVSLTGPLTELFKLIYKDQAVPGQWLANRLFVLNNKIPLYWLNLSMDTFKIKCKDVFLNYIESKYQ